MSFDWIVLTSSFSSFAVFVFLQAVVFRLVHPDAVLKWIINIFMGTSILHCALTVMWYSVIVKPLPGSFMVMLFLSYLIFGMTAFVYILCVFGPSETSIRIRLLRELFEQKGGRLSHQDLLAKYNGQMILERRIDRLLLAQEIEERDGLYALKNKSNTFFLIDKVAGIIQGLIRKTS